jgi:hypothetical protein
MYGIHPVNYKLTYGSHPNIQNRQMRHDITHTLTFCDPVT